MRIIKKAVKVGNGSLMIIISSEIIEKMHIKENDDLVVDIVKKIKKGNKND